MITSGESVVPEIGNMITINYSGGRMSSIVDTVGRQIDIYYNADHRISSIVLPDGCVYTYTYSTAYNLIQVTSSHGYNAEYAYDANRNMTYKKDMKMPAGYTENHLEYDTSNRVIRMRNARSDVDNTLSYAEVGGESVTTITDAKGHASIDTHYANGMLKSSENELGKVTTYTYDAQLNMTSVLTPRGKTYTMEYDANNNMTKKIDPLLNETNYEYDSYNRLTRIENALGIAVVFTYDSYDQLTNVLYPDTTDCDYVYNALGLLEQSTDQMGRTTGYEYNSYGALNKKTLPGGQFISMTSNVMGRITTHTDTAGKVRMCQ